MAEGLTRSDQLAAISRSVGLAIPVNMLLGVTITFMAACDGKLPRALAWFVASTIVNLVRLRIAKAGVAAIAGEHGARPVAALLRASWTTALASGTVWAALPLLTQNYASPEAIFYLVVLCGTTAGAVTHGVAYARVPLCFSLPPLLSAACCLAAQGDMPHGMLAGTVILYAAGLVRAAYQSDRAFRDTARIKNGATKMAASLSAAYTAADRAAEESRRRATHDSLTGLLNRDGFLSAMRIEASSKRELCLFLLDLDGFKSVNDLFGHQMGDRVLVEVAARLCDALPMGSHVARLGGDEFAVLVTREDVPEHPSMLARRLIARVADVLPFLETCRIGAGVGIRLSRGEDPTRMLANADAALYAAKRAGRNRHYLYDEELRRQRARRTRIERDLAQAMAMGAVHLVFQPITSPDAISITGYEALLRWDHPALGAIAPPEILDAGAASGLVEPLFRTVLDGTCALIEGLLAQGRDDVVVAMNLSPREMHHAPVADIILAELAERALPPRMLRIEITEEVALDAAQVDGQLSALTAAGVRLAIDDFGTGYSSLARLRILPVDCVKIDRSFTRGIATSDKDRALVEAIVAIGRSLDITVVAEGVETPDQLRILKRLGLVHLQGWLLSRPITLEAALSDDMVWGERTRSASRG